MFDLIVVGAGPAGYVAAGHAAKMGKSVLLAEKDSLGGVCLNRGCVPTKSLLHSAKLYEHARNSAAFGVTVRDARLDYGTARARTDKVRDSLRSGIAAMMRKGKVEVVAGEAVMTGRKTVRVNGRDCEGANILLCTGSSPVLPPIPGIEGNGHVVDSSGILELESMPERLCVVGGGVIGIEFACLYALAGKKVDVVEMLPRICGNADREIATAIQRKLESRGVAVNTGAKVSRIDGGRVFFVDKAGKEAVVEADLVLAAAGRAANVGGLGFDRIGLDFDRRGVKVNERAETNLPGVYAAGDVTGRWQLAHFASRQGLVAVRNMFGDPDICREDAIPAVIYTDPEAASVGITEDQAKERGIPHRVVKVPLAMSGRFMAETEGERAFVKAVLGGRDRLLGMHILGPYASEMIGAACVMLEAELRAGDIREIVFPHPTVAEIMKEVMFA